MFTRLCVTVGKYGIKELQLNAVEGAKECKHMGRQASARAHTRTDVTQPLLSSRGPCVHFHFGDLVSSNTGEAM